MLKENAPIALDLIRPHPKNYRVHTPAQIRALVASLQRFGQGRSIVCQPRDDGTYLLIAGHGVYAAARQLGYQELRADLLPSTWSEQEITGYLVADNHISTTAGSDQEKLLALLREQEPDDFLSLGSSEQEVRALLESLAFDDLPLEPEMQEEATIPLKPELTRYEPPRYVAAESMPHTIAVPETAQPARIVASAPGTTPDESLFRYNSTTIRQIVLIYSQQEYSRAMDILGHIREQQTLDTNTDAVTHLLNGYAAQHGLEMITLDE